MNLTSITVASICLLQGATAWNAAIIKSYNRRSSSSSELHMNLFDMLGVGNKLDSIDPSSLPIDPLCASDSIGDDVRCFAVAERLFSFTGEDFDIYEGGVSFARVRGAMLHLPGKDKMRVVSSSLSSEIAVLDRVLLAMSPSYDIYNGSSEKVGWLEKDKIALTDSFSLYKEGAGIGPFKSPPAYRISGDFIDRNFVMKTEEGKVVARISKVSNL